MASDSKTKTAHQDTPHGASSGRARRRSRRGFVVLEAESGLEALIERLRRRALGSR